MSAAPPILSIRPPASEPVAGAPPSDSGAVCLSLLLRFHGKAASVAQLMHEVGAPGQPLGDDDLLRLASRHGLRARRARSRRDRLARLSLPAIAKGREGGYFILARISEDQALVQVPGAGQPEVLRLDELEQRWSGELILVTTRFSLSGATRHFDVRWFIPSIVRYRALFGHVLLASLFIQIFALVTPILFQVVLDKVLVHRGISTLHVVVFGLTAMSCFEVLLGGLRSYIFSHTTTRVDIELGAKFFDHLLRLPLAYYESRRVGDTVARARELETVRNFLTGSLLTVFLDLVFAAVFFVVMYFYSPLLTAIVLASIPFYVVLSVLVTPVLRERIEDKFRLGAENQALLVESITGMETLKAMAVEPQVRRRWEDRLAAYVRSSFDVQTLGMTASQAVQLIQKLTMVLLLWLGATEVMDGSLTIGALIAFNMISRQVTTPILRLAQLWQDLQQVRVSIARMGDVLNTPAEPGTHSARSSLPVLRGGIRFENVSFRYAPGRPEVLADLSFEIQPGEIVGVVGPSGSGKSTLAKLIQRLYVPERGRVLIDGVDVAMIDPAWLRRQIGVVLQENVLFRRSIRENIALADPGMPMERVETAARLAGAHDFILELPQGYDSEIEERGSSLSGGQRQRVAIARALVGDPKILLFDEATSALDYESERVIQNNMKRMCRGRTVIVIAHRLAAVRHADRILTIERGRITEMGSHDELLKLGGTYARLHHLQGARDAVA